MSIFTINLLILAGIAVTAGWLAGLVTRGSGFGLIGNMLTAAAGACVIFYIGSGLVDPLGLFGVALLDLSGAFFALWLIGRMRR